MKLLCLQGQLNPTIVQRHLKFLQEDVAKEFKKFLFVQTDPTDLTEKQTVTENVSSGI